MKHEWTERLSDYLDGRLPDPEAAAVEGHLEECGDCRTTLEELRAVVHRARSLADREPSQDLWPGISEALVQGEGQGDVIDLASRTGGGWLGARRVVRLTVPQLAAAALALVLASGSGAWLLRPDLAPAGGPAPSEVGSDVPAVQAAARELASPDDWADATQTDELAELEELLARHRSELAPHTVRILEKNLAAIDRAIEDSRRALAVDPGNTFLEVHLERARQRKLEYLRDASVAFQWSS